jgi:hypothetical protein
VEVPAQQQEEQERLEALLGVLFEDDMLDKALVQWCSGAVVLVPSSATPPHPHRDAKQQDHGKRTTVNIQQSDTRKMLPAGNHVLP